MIRTGYRAFRPATCPRTIAYPGARIDQKARRTARWLGQIPDSRQATLQIWVSFQVVWKGKRDTNSDETPILLLHNESLVFFPTVRQGLSHTLAPWQFHHPFDGVS